jgi:hypothetical protein
MSYIVCIAGHGVFLRKDVCRGDFLLHYQGELLSYEDALKREQEYSEREQGFMFFFRNGSEKFW